ncbi:telomere length regulation protein [Xylaria digitata]|nr:telomere length regulation protein [Xylaria digitata]
MADFLVPVSKAYTKGSEPDNFLSLSKAAGPVKVLQTVFKGTSPEEALECLKNQPSYDILLAVLKYLRNGGENKPKFDIRTPGPLGAQIIHMLVTEIVPNYWTVLQESSDDINNLLACLRSLPGISAALTYIRSLIREAKSQPKDSGNSHIIFNLIYTSSLLASLLGDDGEVMHIWDHIASTNDPTRVRPLRQDFLSLFTSGKIVSLSAEAEDICRQAGRLTEPLWIADNKQYIGWLARNQIQWAKSQSSEESLKLCAEFGARALRLGHAEIFVRELFHNLLLQDDAGKELFSKLVNIYPPPEQRKVLLLLLKLLSDFHLNSISDSDANEEYPTIWASVGVLRSIVAGNEAQRNNLVAWLTSASGAGVGEGCGIRRAAVAALADHKESISTVLERSLNQFSDQLYIKHTPILQQEAHAQVLLLSAGYVHRLTPMKLTVLLRSSAYLNAVSNRLAESQSRARFLGMVVGEALSGLVHGKESKLDFKMEDMTTEEADWYKYLVHVSDKAGPSDPLRTSIPPSQARSFDKPARKARKPISPQPRKAPANAPAKAGFIIEEVEDDDEQEDPDLVPYAKPDSDAEDSDDDPTLINRNKPKAPVYIRDLISYLRDTENYDKQKLALTTAPTLIRRKANYGTEVVSHAEDLASLLIGLQDKFELENFYNLRLQGMVAVVVAQPKKIAPWFAKTFFDGDYSLSQRASILVVLGLSGREIGGFEISEYASTAHFPSKTLPSKVEKHYLQPSSVSNRLQAGTNLKALPPNALDTLAQSLSQSFLAPMAAEAADAATGPDALKLSSFTSRLEQSQANSSITSKRRGIRSIPNTTASLISTSFFFPLSSRFQAAMRSSAMTKIIFQPYLLALYLKTLGLLIHAAGPSTLALPQMTAELWDLVLGVRGRCLGSNTTGGEGEGDMAVTHAVLLALAALLDVNEGDVRGLCERQGRQVVESMEWVGNVFHNTRGGDGAGEENDVKMLAAGILIRLREAVDKYQAVLMGDLVGFT